MSETLEVLCRLKPCNESEPCVIPIDDQYVKVIPPRGYERRGNVPNESVYKFGCVFDETVSQKDVFNRSTVDLIRGALNGVDGLLFTYGITGAGKTYTMTGDDRDTGILPRTVDVIFNSLANPVDKCIFYPTSLNRFGVRSETEARYQRRSQPVLEIPTSNREFESLTIRNVPNSMASAVFISYIEIYNEYCYDLFDENLTTGNRLNMTKDVRAGPKDAAYVEGLTEIEVTSTDEVLMHYEKAQERRKVAETRLNHQSSRSHSIFQIKIVMAPFEGNGYHPETDPNKIIVSQIVLVDLAGSERANRTRNKGERLVEASKINNSLMSLRQCFEKLRENQRNPKQQSIISYRDSKLTHLFKKYFLGGGNIKMIICVDPKSDNYEENLNVLGFAELSQNVKIELTNIPNIPAGNCLPFPRREVLSWYRMMENKVGTAPIQIELFSPPPKRICLDDSFETNISRIDDVVDYYKKGTIKKRKLIDIFSDKRRDFTDDIMALCCEADLSREKINRLEDENFELQHRLEVVHKQLLHANRKIDALNKRLFEYEEVDKTRYEAEMDLRKKNAMIEKDLEKKNRDFRVVRQICDDVAINGVSGPSVALLASKFDAEAVESTTRTPNGQKTTTFHPDVQVQSVSRQGRRNGYVNPKYHRRSQSATGRILDHQPTNKIPTGSVLRPHLPRTGVKKTIAPSRRDLQRSDAYILTHQEIDNEGNVSTNIIKGECIPTSGGGRYVKFEDIENLQHQSPSA
uniref:Kinesin-like protein n=1 Tax=Parastrongyloides trichosuri TaxID=131310 RepID=A0A0N5A3B2_PARTI